MRHHPIIVASAVHLRIKRHRKPRHPLYVVRRHLAFAQHQASLAVDGMEVFPCERRRDHRDFTAAHRLGFFLCESNGFHGAFHILNAAVLNPIGRNFADADDFELTPFVDVRDGAGDLARSDVKRHHHGTLCTGIHQPSPFFTFCGACSFAHNSTEARSGSCAAKASRYRASIFCGYPCITRQR